MRAGTVAGPGPAFLWRVPLVARCCTLLDPDRMAQEDLWI